jgi:hypothetical protein
MSNSLKTPEQHKVFIESSKWKEMLAYPSNHHRLN